MLKVGSVYTVNIVPSSPSYYRKSVMMKMPDDYLHPIYKFFENEPFLVVEESKTNGVGIKKYRIFIEDSVWILWHYDNEPEIQINLVC